MATETDSVLSTNHPPFDPVDIATRSTCASVSLQWVTQTNDSLSKSALTTQTSKPAQGFLRTSLTGLLPRFRCPLSSPRSREHQTLSPLGSKNYSHSTLDVCPPFPVCVRTALTGVLRPTNTVAGRSKSVIDERDVHIRTQIEAHAPNKESYSLVAKVVNVGVALLVYAKDDAIARRVCDVQTQWTGSGPAYMGNKGAVGIRFRVSDRGSKAGEVFTSVCSFAVFSSLPRLWQFCLCSSHSPRDTPQTQDSRLPPHCPDSSLLGVAFVP